VFMSELASSALSFDVFVWCPGVATNDWGYNFKSLVEHLGLGNPWNGVSNCWDNSDGAFAPSPIACPRKWIKRRPDQR
jgi:hypothetical protein